MALTGRTALLAAFGALLVFLLPSGWVLLAMNGGLLLAGTPGHVPGTPAGVVALLDEYGVELQGA